MEYQVWEVNAHTQCFLASVQAVASWEWPVLYTQMPSERQKRCDRYRRERDRQACILADALARAALAERLDTAPAAIALSYPPKGKPFAPGSEVEFSLSHSGVYVLCAVAPVPVGVDIQRQRPVSSAMLSRLGRAGYTGSSEEDFFSWWVRQEAGGKLLGTGLSLRPLPGGLTFRPGTLDGPDGKYFYCIAEKIRLF